jgi:TolB-like protein
MVQHPEELLSKDLLLQTLWPGVVVEESSLSQSVSALRKALGDDAQKPRFIQTVPRRGFRFVAPVVAIDDADADADANANRATWAPVQTSGPVPPPAITSTDIRTAPAGRQRRRWALLAATGLVSAAAGGLLWRASRPGPAVRASNTLAVLPFKPIAEASRDELLEVGMAESLVARLSNLPGVAVRSVGSVRRYAGAEQDPIRAARELQVTWIIDGSVQRAGGRVRVTARLLNTASGEAAWSGSFDETVTSVFDLQDVISRKRWPRSWRLISNARARVGSPAQAAPATSMPISLIWRPASRPRG